MKTLMKLACVSLFAISANSYATVMNVGGIQYDALTSGGAQGNVRFQQWYSGTAYGAGTEGQAVINSNTAVAPGTGLLTGVGIFTDFNVNRTLSNNFLNDLVNSAMFPTYCTDATSGCSLTFAFGGLAVQSIVGNQVTFNPTNSFLNIYFQSTMPSALAAGAGSTPLNMKDSFSALQTGTLWASLKFNSFVLTGDVLGGAVNSTLDLVSGLPQVIKALDFGNLDFKLTGNAIIDPTKSLYSENGGGAFQSVSAPSSVAILGLGLLGLAGVARRKQAKAA